MDLHPNTVVKSDSDEAKFGDNDAADRLILICSSKREFTSANHLHVFTLILIGFVARTRGGDSYVNNIM